jgi:hypothetical protein
MTPKLKSLLLQVSISWTEQEFSRRYDSEREAKVTEALGRLEIDVENPSFEHDTLSEMLDSGEEVLQWLVDHPKARIMLGYWSVIIQSEEWDDVNHEAHDRPFGFRGAVENFSKERDECCWFLG